MTVAQLISQGAVRLANVSDSAALDAEVLLAFTLDLSRTELLQHANSLVEANVEDFFLRLIDTRRRGIPVAYITGRQAFMDFEVLVTPHTLIPRPFTETLVEAILHALGDHKHVVSDIGTGSGAIALAIAKRATKSRVIATDVSVPALRVAATNAREQNLLRRIDFRVGSLLHPLRLDDSVTAVVANLPYLPSANLTEPSIRHEPPVALHGGADGLVLIEQLLRQTRSFPTLQLLALELLPEQADVGAYFLRQLGFTAEPISDGQSVRGLIGQK